MTTSLITGADGFIGSHVVDHVLNMGHDVIAVDDLSGRFLENVHIYERKRRRFSIYQSTI